MKMLRYTAQHRLHLSNWAKCVGLTTGAAVLSYPAENGSSDVWLADVSHLPRICLKGPNAAEWLCERKLDVPPAANRWLPIARSPWSLIARLGSTEFMLEQEGSARTVQQLGQALQAHVPGVYPVLREDSEFVIGGSRAERVLAEVCNLDFAVHDVRTQSLYLTTMIGVSVLVIPQQDSGCRRYRIWCDPSFGFYVWTTLTQLIAEHSGAIVGLEQLQQAPELPPISERVVLGEDVA